VIFVPFSNLITGERLLNPTKELMLRIRQPIGDMLVKSFAFAEFIKERNY
jgi:hypothetical protein